MRPHRHLTSATLVAVGVLFAATVVAQVELSRADRLAILYTPQLQFAPSGEPLVKIGVAEGIDRIEFSADTPVTVLPIGDGGSEITVPADTTFTVSIANGQPGTYAYAAVVAELTPDQREQVAPLRAQWEARGYTVRTRQVGSIFAVTGQRFDTRKTLLTIGDTSSRTVADALVTEVAREYGIESRLHSELDDYPGGLLTIDGLPGGATIRNRDLLWVRGTDQTAFTVRDVPYDRWMGGDRSETRRYVGALIFTADRDGQLAVVNETTIERLVEGILPAELYPNSPEHAMRAQAVAARSELLADLGVRHQADPYMTCSDQRCQVYRGIDYERAAETDAVRATHGEILADGDQVIKAYFSSNNGGFAASNAWTWGEEQRAYLVAHPDGPSLDPALADGLDEPELRDFLASPPDSFSRIARATTTFRWTRAVAGSELSAAVAQRYPGVGAVTGLRILERGPSGRVARLAITGTDGSVVVERELNVRLALGGDRPLMSALFVVDVEAGPDGVIASAEFQGAGFGHGVGLCQSGAVGMADRGYEYRDILDNYYRGTELRTLY